MSQNIVRKPKEQNEYGQNIQIWQHYFKVMKSVCRQLKVVFWPFTFINIGYFRLGYFENRNPTKFKVLRKQFIIVFFSNIQILI